MKIRKAEVINNQTDEIALFIHAVDADSNDRFFIGSAESGRWVYGEIPTPNASNTYQVGGTAR